MEDMDSLQSQRESPGNGRKSLKRIAVGEIANVACERAQFAWGQKGLKMRPGVENEVRGFTVIGFEKLFELSERCSHGGGIGRDSYRGGQFGRKRRANGRNGGVERLGQGVKRGRNRVIGCNGRFG